MDDKKDPEKSGKLEDEDEASEDEGSEDEGNEDEGNEDEGNEDDGNEGEGNEDEDNEDHGNEDESKPLTPDAAKVKDEDTDEVTDLTGAEEKVLRRLRSQRSDYSRSEHDEEEKADMNTKSYTELSPLDHWTAKAAPGSVNNWTQLSPLDHWASKVNELSNEDPPDSDGMAMTSFIEQPLQERSESANRQMLLPRGAAPVASIEDMDEITDLTCKRDDRYTAPIEARGQRSLGEMIELRDIQLHDMERAGPPEEIVEAFECTRLGWFNWIGTLLGRVYSQLCTTNSTLSRTKRILGIMGLVILAYLIIFIGLFSSSFEYVNYYNIALRQSRLTGVVDRDTVLYPGCYILGPDADLIYFDSTAQTIMSKVSVFTSDKLIIDVDVSLQYFLRPEEVGKLHTKFGQNYHVVFESLVFNTIKNEATQHSLEEFRLSRPQLEKIFFQKVRERLGGTCCSRCCPSSCDVIHDCSSCQPQGSCDQAYHIDIDYFQLGRIRVPDAVFERYMKQTILLIESEREVFIQQHALEVKKTEREYKAIVNQAAEIKANATAYSKVHGLIAEAQKEATVQSAYIGALKDLYKRLNMTVEDHKLSLMMIRAFEDMHDNLFSYGFEKSSLSGK